MADDDRRQTQRVVLLAAISAGALIAYQVGGKATRDALFLSNFPITALPTMLISASVLSIVFVLVAARVLTRYGPNVVVPLALGASAALTLGEWALALASFDHLAAVLLYLHIAALGAVLISGYWSMINELFNPHTARRSIGRINIGATLGGLVGGFIASRVGPTLGAMTMLPILAGLHAVCAVLAVLLTRGQGAGTAGRVDVTSTAPHTTGDGGNEQRAARPTRSGFRILGEVSYLRNLAILVLISTVAATLIDYVFKARATELVEASDLLGFFAIYYTALSLITFLLQFSVGAITLERFGLVRSVASLPAVTTLGAVGAFLVPGLTSAGIARGAVSIIHSSIFRSGYELFFTPVLAEEKRATKTIIDVGFERLGDALGGGAVQLALILLPATLLAGSLLGTAVILGLLGLLLAYQLHRGWKQALEKSLVEQGRRKLDDLDPSASAVMHTVAAGQLSQLVDLRALREAVATTGNAAAGGAAAPGSAAAAAARTATAPSGTTSRRVSGLEQISWPATAGGGLASAVSRARIETTRSADPILQAATDLRSGDPARVHRALHEQSPLPPELVGHALSLLAWNDVYREVIRALRPIADRSAGQLADALLDESTEFAIRRRLPRAFFECTSPRAVGGLTRGLRDRRFEVRYNCGHALAILRDRNPDMQVDRDEVLAVIEGELSVARGVWDSQRLLDSMDSTDQWSLVDEVIKERTNQSLEHVFTLLSLVLPREPLKIAYRGLLTDDPALRGTALEYLESVLPPAIRRSLSPYLDGSGAVSGDDRPREEILADLMEKHQSIEINLDQLRDV